MWWHMHISSQKFHHVRTDEFGIIIINLTRLGIQTYIPNLIILFWSGKSHLYTLYYHNIFIISYLYYLMAPCWTNHKNCSVWLLCDEFEVSTLLWCHISSLQIRSILYYSSTNSQWCNEGDEGADMPPWNTQIVHDHTKC